MSEIMSRFNEDHYEYESGLLDFPIQKLEFSIKKNEIKSGTIFITSQNAKHICGRVVSSHYRMELKKEEFDGTFIELGYQFGSNGLEEGDVVKGEFSIISNIGEFYLPFLVQIEQTVLNSSMGNVKNLFHFANLAKGSWKEAVELFYSEDFVSVFSGSDRQHLGVYRGLSKHVLNERNLEEFLVCVRKKQPISFHVDQSVVEIERSQIIKPKRIQIERNGWGYTELEVSVEGQFIEIDKSLLLEQDFSGNRCEVQYFIKEEALHEGNNFGKIIVYSKAQKFEIIVKVIRNKVPMSAFGYKKELKQLRFQILDQFVLYSLGKKEKSTWILQTEQIVEKMNMINNKDVLSRLFQAYLLVEQEKLNEARWILKRVETMFAEDPRASSEIENYTFYLYIMSKCEVEQQDFYEKEICEIYLRHSNRMSIFFLRLDCLDDYNNATKKLIAIEEQYYKGIYSPLLYTKAFAIYKASPSYFSKLGRFELSIAEFVLKNRVMTKEIALQMTMLASRMRDYNERVIKILEKCYEAYQDVEILRVLTSLLIKGNVVKKEAHIWFDLAIQKELRITKLYDYFWMSRPTESTMDVPRIVYLYFSYENNLDSDYAAALYYDVVKNKELHPDIYAQYYDKIRLFLMKQIRKKRISMNLAYLYQQFADGLLSDESVAKEFLDLVFAHLVEIERDDIKKVILIQENIVGEKEYAVVNKVATVPIITNEFQILLEDANKNRYVNSINFSIKKLMIVGKVGKYLAPVSNEHFAYQLYLSQLYNSYQMLEQDNLLRYEMLFQSEQLDFFSKKSIQEHLVRYYYEHDLEDKLDVLLDQVDVSYLSQKERGEIIRYLVVREKYERALNYVNQFGYEGVGIKVLIRLCTNLITEDMDYQKSTLNMAAYVFFRDKYNELMLKYLNLYYFGNVKKMRDIWNASILFDIDARDIAERILKHIFFSNGYIATKHKVFSYYYKKTPKQQIVNAYLSHNAYDYIVREKIVEDDVFYVLEKELLDGAALNDCCKLAYIKYFSNHFDEIDSKRTQLICNILTKLLVKDMFFPFYLKFKEVVPYLKIFENKTFVEFKSEENFAEIELHYLFENQSNAGAEYSKEVMKEVFGGNYLKQFNLFFGERLQYYISEKTKSSEKLTESGVLEKSDIAGSESESKYEMLNDIVISSTLQDFDTVDELLIDYQKKTFLSEKIFNIK